MDPPEGEARATGGGGPGWVPLLCVRGHVPGIIFAMRSQNTENIILIGMPGVGKSTLGVVLAKVLNRSFLDVDLLIQRTGGKTLQEMIDEEGVVRFIARENEALVGIECERTIVSTGGSAVYSAQGMEHLRKMGTVVYLKTTTEDLESRIGSLAKRGVVSSNGDISALSELHAERAPLYDRYADIVVETQGMTMSEALEAVLAALAAHDAGSFSQEEGS